MKRVMAMILITLLVVPPASASEKPGKPIDWQKAQTLEPGTEVILTVTGGQPTKLRLLCVDEAALVTRKTTPQALPRRVEELLVKIGPEWSAVLNGSTTITSGPLRVSKDWIFDGDQRLCALADAVQQTARGDVQEIARPRGHGLLTTLTLVALGCVVFLGWLAIAFFSSPIIG
jgi:hypothetical protein